MFAGHGFQNEWQLARLTLLPSQAQGVPGVGWTFGNYRKLLCRMPRRPRILYHVRVHSTYVRTSTRQAVDIAASTLTVWHRFLRAELFELPDGFKAAQHPETGLNIRVLPAGLGFIAWLLWCRAIDGIPVIRFPVSTICCTCTLSLYDNRNLTRFKAYSIIKRSGSLSLRLSYPYDPY